MFTDLDKFRLISLDHFLDDVESLIYEGVIAEARVSAVVVSVRIGVVIILLNQGLLKTPQALPETVYVPTLLQQQHYINPCEKSFFTDAQLLFFGEGEGVRGAGGGTLYSANVDLYSVLKLSKDGSSSKSKSESSL